MKKEKLSERNKRFWAMPKAKQRVAVAVDILKQLECNFYSAESGTYFEFSHLDNIDSDSVPLKLDELLAEAKKKKAICNVCQIGAAFTSLVRLGDKAESQYFLGEGGVGEGSGIGSIEMRTQLEKVFSSDQICLIECAFESSTSYNRPSEGYNAPYEVRKKAADFGGRYLSDKSRMVAICKNIIKNKGTFIP